MAKASVKTLWYAKRTSKEGKTSIVINPKLVQEQKAELAAKQLKLEKKKATVRTLRNIYLGAGAATLAAGGVAAAPAAVAAGVGKVIVAHPIASLIGVPTVAGLLIKSPTARGITKEYLNPLQAYKRGKTLGDIIENIKREGVAGLGTNLKTAGLTALGLIGGAGAIITIKKAYDWYKKKKSSSKKSGENVLNPEDIAGETPIGAPALIGGVPESMAIPQEIPAIESITEQKAFKPMNITQRVNIKISNKSSANKRYLNNYIIA